MNRLSALPRDEEVHAAAKEIIDQAKETGSRPSVLAVARRVGMSNTTFRRNFPDIARELSERRRTPTPDVEGSPTAQRYTTLQERNAKLLRDNKTLSDHVELAVANIMRLTLENRQLRTELEATIKVTRIDAKPTRGR